jgi:hypothetical protein
MNLYKMGINFSNPKPKESLQTWINKPLEKLLDEYPTLMVLRKDTLTYLLEKNRVQYVNNKIANKKLEEKRERGELKGLMGLVAYGKVDSFYTDPSSNPKIGQPSPKEIEMEDRLIKEVETLSITSTEYDVLENSIVNIIPHDFIYNYSLFNGNLGNIDDPIDKYIDQRLYTYETFLYSIERQERRNLRKELKASL